MELVGYVRVSTKGQADDGFGAIVQEAAIRQWAQDNGHHVLVVCVDAGVSGTVAAADRPGLTEALDLLRPPPVATGLVVARLDRLARTLHVQEAALAVVWPAGASVFTVDGGEVLRDDPADPLRTLLRQIVGSVAQFERSLVIKRMRDGRQAKAATGRHAVGGYAYGYHGDGKGRDRDAAPDEAEQRAVRHIVALRSGGASYRQIATQLDTEGLTPRRAQLWSAMTVRSVVLRQSGA